MKQKEMALWLKLITLVAGVMGLLLSFYVIPMAADRYLPEYSGMELLWLPVVTFTGITAIPCYLVLWKFWGICGRIGADRSFCMENARAMKQISQFLMIDCVLYGGMELLLAVFGFQDFLIHILVLVIFFVFLILTILSAALSHFVLKASEIEQENDLTI